MLLLSGTSPCSRYSRYILKLGLCNCSSRRATDCSGVSKPVEGSSQVCNLQLDTGQLQLYMIALDIHESMSRNMSVLPPGSPCAGSVATLVGTPVALHTLLKIMCANMTPTFGAVVTPKWCQCNTMGATVTP